MPVPPCRLILHCNAGEGGGEAEEEGRAEEEEARGSDQAHGGRGGQERSKHGLLKFSNQIGMNNFKIQG